MNLESKGPNLQPFQAHCLCSPASDLLRSTDVSTLWIKFSSYHQHSTCTVTHVRGSLKTEQVIIPEISEDNLFPYSAFTWNRTHYQWNTFKGTLVRYEDFMAVNVKITTFWNLSTKLQGITSHKNIYPKNNSGLRAFYLASLHCSSLRITSTLKNYHNLPVSNSRMDICHTHKSCSLWWTPTPNWRSTSSKMPCCIS